MPTFGAIKRKDLIKALKKAGFEGPFAGGKHEFLIKGGTAIGSTESTSWRHQQRFTDTASETGEHQPKRLGRDRMKYANGDFNP